MTLPVAVQLGVVAAIILVGSAVESRLATTEPLVRVPHSLRVLVLGLALGGPFVLVNHGILTDLAGLDEVVVGLGAALVSSTVVMWVVGGTTADDCRVRNWTRPED